MNNNHNNKNIGGGSSPSQHGYSQNSSSSMGEYRAPNYVALYFSVFFATLILLIAVAFMTWMVISYRSDSKNNTDSGNIDDTDIYIDTSSDDGTLQAQDETQSVITSVTLSEEDISGGTLMLLNPTHSVTDDDGIFVKSIYELKNYNYQVASTELSLNEVCIEMLNEMMTDFRNSTGHSDVNVTSAYRDYDEQMSIYSAYVQTYGLAEAEKEVAKGGCSDHNTGYGFNLAVYTSGGYSYELDYDSSYMWLAENCYKYGFVLRYPQGKTEYTTFYEPWHFRYVGIPHAYYMYQNNLCLEEYLTLLDGYRYGESILEFSDDDGKNWQIFTVKPNNSGIYNFECSTENYTVSYTNCGFIVVTTEK